VNGPELTGHSIGCVAWFQAIDRTLRDRNHVVDERIMRSGAIPRPRIAIIDDYQRVALGFADWGRLGADVQVFHEPMSSEDQAAELLKPFPIITLMRERTPFPASLIERLPRLRLLSMTGHRTTTLDIDACTRGGVLARIIHRTARNRPRPPNTWARDFIAKNFIKQPIRIVVNDINGLALIAHFS